MITVHKWKIYTEGKEKKLFYFEINKFSIFFSFQFEKYT